MDNIKFDLDRLGVIDDDMIKKYIDELEYSIIKKQIDAIEPIDFGSPMNILLISDRLLGCAKGLKEYLQSNPSITVDLVNTSADAVRIIRGNSIDFLIIVGLLKDETDYNVVKFFKRVNKYSGIIFYALLDNAIKDLCKKYVIDYTYDRRRLPDNLCFLMKGAYLCESMRIQDVYPNVTLEQTKEIRLQIRREVLKDIIRSEAEQPQKKCLGIIAALLRYLGL